MAKEKEVEKWVTVHGKHLPIFKDGSVGGSTSLNKKSNIRDIEDKIIKNRLELRQCNDPVKKRKLIEENHELMKSLDKKYESMTLVRQNKQNKLKKK